MELEHIIMKHAWFWEKEYWWIIAINEIVACSPDVESVVLTVPDINYVLEEIAGNVWQRFCTFILNPLRVSLKAPPEITLYVGNE